MRVQITLEGDDYAALKKLADEEDRGVAQQARHLLRKALGEPLWGPIVMPALRDPQSETAHDIHSGLQGEHQPETHDVTGSPDHDAESRLSMDDITLNARPSLREDGE